MPRQVIADHRRAHVKYDDDIVQDVDRKIIISFSRDQHGFW